MKPRVPRAFSPPVSSFTGRPVQHRPWKRCGGHCPLPPGGSAVRARAGQRAGSWALTGSRKDDRGGHAAPPARPRGSGAGGVAQGAEEAAIAEDEQLQGAVWGCRGGQGRWGRREQAGRQLDGGQGHAVLGGTQEFLRDARGPWDSAGPQAAPCAPPASPPAPPAPQAPHLPPAHPPAQHPASPMPTLMWKADRDTLGLPVVQRKRSCWSARGSGSGDGGAPGPLGRMKTPGGKNAGPTVLARWW